MATDLDLKSMMAYLDEHPDEIATAEQLAARSGFSYYYFCHRFRAEQGVSLSAYLRTRRLERAAGQLRAGASVKEVAAAGGFGTVSGFSRAFKRQYGINASDYRRQSSTNDHNEITIF